MFPEVEMHLSSCQCPNYLFIYLSISFFTPLPILLKKFELTPQMGYLFATKYSPNISLSESGSPHLVICEKWGDDDDKLYT